MKTNQPARFKKLIHAENTIRSLNYEELVVFDSQTGDIVYSTVGVRSSVDISEAKRKGLLSSNIMTHNHPTGTAFSPRDIKVLIENNLHEMRVVTEQFTHSMIFIDTPTKDKLKKLVSVYNEAFAETRKDKTDERFHLVWEKVASKLDFLVYNRT